MNHSLTDIEFSKVCKVIASNMGLSFPSDRRAMVSRGLIEAAKDLGFHNMKEFLQWFLTATLKDNQIEILASYLTISETYFWREQQVFDAFTQNILPELVASKKDQVKSISIWCAGCSTGEEAYSIAIALCRIIPEIKDWKIKIFATDINTKALSKARDGVYGSWSFRNSPSWLKEHYFKKINHREYEVIPEIKEMVTFSSFNLISGDYSSSICKNYRMDVIFCRNVLMYFTSEWASKVSQNLFESLLENGWLIVSSCELSSDLFPKLTPVNFPDSVLYHKGKEAFLSDNIHYYLPHNELYNKKSLSPSVNSDKQLLSPDYTLITKNNGSYSDPEINSKPDIPMPDLLKPQLVVKTRNNILNESKTAIRMLADNGHLEEALLFCNNTIADNKLTAGLYYLRASILQEQNKIQEAIKSLKQVIYIDPDSIMGHFTLGNIFLQQGFIKKGKQYFINALKLLNTRLNEEIPAESDGLSVMNIRGIILASLQTH